MKYFLLAVMVLLFTNTHAQNVGIGTTAPKASALLDVNAADKGVLLPRMTTPQRRAINNPERGLLVFDTDKASFMFFDGVNWKSLGNNEEDLAILTNRNESTPTDNAHFGQVVDISGNYAVIGAPFYLSPGFGNKVGEAYVFFKDQSGWKMQARLVAPDSAAFDFFGSGVAIYGDYCVVACPQKTIGVNYSQGKVYVYKRNGTAWNLEAQLTDPAGGTGDNFGYSVDVTLTSGGLPVIAVGAINGNGSKGQVITFSRNAVSGIWNYLQKLTPADLGAGDQFGLSVSMHKDYLAVGAPRQANQVYSATYAGAAYIYVFGGGVFTQQQKLPGSYTDAQYGYTLSMYEDKLAVAAPWASASGGTGSGEVRILKRNGANWEYSYSDLSIPVYSGGSLNMRYGLRLSITNNQLLIGAPSGIIFPSGSSIGGTLPGMAYLYITTDGGTYYYLKQKFNAPSPVDADLFAHGVALEENGNYIIGMPYQNVFAGDTIRNAAGGVYFGYYVP